MQPERTPQSLQSVHAVHEAYSEPSPPSSHSPSDAKAHVFTHVPLPGGPGDGGGDGDAGGGRGGRFGALGGRGSQLPGSREPQSAQSWQASHEPYSLPLPPSSQSPSCANWHVFMHVPPPGGPGGGVYEEGDES